VSRYVLLPRRVMSLLKLMPVQLLILPALQPRLRTMQAQSPAMQVVSLFLLIKKPRLKQVTIRQTTH
ncbi:hypothetical protein PZ02_07455, partial [Lacticaseibacillus rhamnosus]